MEGETSSQGLNSGSKQEKPSDSEASHKAWSVEIEIADTPSLVETTSHLISSHYLPRPFLHQAHHGSHSPSLQDTYEYSDQVASCPSGLSKMGHDE